jgi:hypothetical protein
VSAIDLSSIHQIRIIRPGFHYFDDIKQGQRREIIVIDPHVPGLTDRLEPAMGMPIKVPRVKMGFTPGSHTPVAKGDGEIVLSE